MVTVILKKIVSFFTFKNVKNNINIHKTVSLSANVILDNKFGGEINIGKNCELLNGVMLMTYGGNITIGNNCSINPYTILYGHGNLSIGNDVLIAGHCLIIPANHKFEDLEILIRKQGLYTKGIVIENNVWIGAGCRILDGITIGEGSIIAAGAVVNKDVAPFTVVGGIPAKFIKLRK